ncbi:MAG TPA: tRNA lysidine(34) synthetase TilS [Opitutales bacterium]|jgi:tRNA(Ile)-lysidine synthase|nr:tRNA lysidine(34) synthetase TilS [Opitutales bacterium]
MAARLGDAFRPARLHARVRGWLEQNAHKNEVWGVAVSGGADSVALLLLLWAHYPQQRKQMVVLHFDHAVRPDSAADAQFVHKLAKALGLPFATARRAPGGAVNEAALRDARMNFFRGQLAARHAHVIFFGHQRDDIAETMLMRLTRGSGASGLCAPRPVREFPDGLIALRPLLNLDHANLCAALKAVGAAWQEDSSNAQGDYLRNRLRHDVIPAWKLAMPERDLNAGVARAREALEDDAAALESLTETLLRDVAEDAPLPLAKITGQPRAIVRRALHVWLHRNGVGENLNAQAFDTLLNALTAAKPSRWSAGPGRWLVLDKAKLTLSGSVTETSVAWPPMVLKPEQTVQLPDGALLRARLVKVDRKLLKQLQDGKINPAQQTLFALPGKSGATVFRVRTWQPGDRYRPLGAPGRRKLQDLFTDKKIPARERRRLPVVCSEGDQPLWAPGLPPAHSHRVTSAARTAMELTYTPFLPIIDSLSI